MRFNRGFTLIELAIVIAIIGILAAAAVPKFTDLNRNAEMSVSVDFLSKLQTSAALYVAQEGRSPTVFSNFVTPNALAYPHTLSTENMTNGPNVTSITPVGYGTKQLVVAYTTYGNVTYYLDGSDVTAAFP